MRGAAGRRGCASPGRAIRAPICSPHPTPPLPNPPTPHPAPAPASPAAEPSQGYRIDFRAAAIVNGNPSWGWNPAGELQLQVAGGLAGVVAPTGAGTFATRPPLGAPAVGGAPPPASLCTGLVDGTVYVAERWGAVAAFTELAVDVGLSDGSPVVGLAFAYRNVDNYYAVVSSPVTGCTAVVKVAGGVPTVLASTSAPGAAVANASAPGGAATRTRLHVAQAGPAITVWLNGRRDAPVLTASDSAGAPLPPGNVGIFAAAANRAVFDNWLLVVAPTCSDGIHNGLEEGPDCGVAACGNACPSETATETVWSAAGGGSLVGWFRETWGTASGAPSWGIVDDASADAGALTQRQNTGLAFQGAPGGNSGECVCAGGRGGRADAGVGGAECHSTAACVRRAAPATLNPAAPALARLVPPPPHHAVTNHACARSLPPPRPTRPQTTGWAARSCCAASAGAPWTRRSRWRSPRSTMTGWGWSPA